jgi:multiple sugar transport system permease protein
MKTLFKINPKCNPANWDRNKRIVRLVAVKTLLYLALVLLAIVMCLPFYWSLITSFRPNDEIYKLPVTLFPSRFTIEHYARVFDEIPFFRMLLNSLITTGTGVFTNLFFGALAAYAFSKIKFRGHKIIFNVLLCSMMIPGVITLIPTFFVLLRFPLAGGNSFLGQGGIGFYDNLAAVILPGAVGVYGIFFMRQFFVSLSDDLAESARIDGAGEFKIFFRIYLPLVLPGLLTLGLFTFQSGWNNFMWPNIVLQSPENQLLTMAFKFFHNSRTTDFGPLMVLSVMMAIPVLILFVFMQKYFVQGVALGGVKE